MNKQFFDAVRPHFGGKLSVLQVEGMERTIKYAQAYGMSAFHLANLMAQVKHETADWFQPIREGCRRQGPAGTDKQAVAAIQAAINKGIIKRNYLGLTHGVRHYGRGLIQITWPENYKKFGIEKTPDKALEWDMASKIVFDGMAKGMFTGKKLSDWGDAKSFDSRTKAWREMRGIVNGDIKLNGAAIASSSSVFYAALNVAGYK